MSSDRLASDKNIAQWVNCTTMNWWAKAIDQLLEMKGFTKTRLDEIRDADGKPKLSHRQLLRAYQGSYGPSVTVLKRLLNAIGASWEEWAIVCNKAEKDLAVHAGKSSITTIKARPSRGQTIKKNISAVSNGE